MTEKNCSTCRYASTDKRPKIMGETGFDDQLMFDDADEVVYTCRAFGVGPTSSRVDGEVLVLSANLGSLCEHAGKEIGLVPIACDAYAEPVKKDMSELDRRIAEREARAAAREK